MTEPITRHRDIESLKTAARWPGSDRATRRSPELAATASAQHEAMAPT